MNNIDCPKEILLLTKDLKLSVINIFKKISLGAKPNDDIFEAWWSKKHLILKTRWLCVLDKKYPIIEWRSEYLTTKPQYDETEEVEDVYLNVVIRSNRQRRYFSTLMAVLSILDRDDICAIYQLVMNRYQDETPEGFDKILWGDLIIMFNQSDSDEFWNAQQNWKIVSWKLHSSSGVHTIMTDEGLVIHMFVENKYPLKKEVLSQLIELKLETEEDSTMALELIRFVKKQIAELEPKDSDGDEEDLKCWLYDTHKQMSSFLMLNRHKNWLVHKQTAYGKDFSNPFMVDNLPKIIWFSTHLASQ
ncbi:hypothetical protein Tco_1138638 [Tanacetum coccineum]